MRNAVCFAITWICFIASTVTAQDSRLRMVIGTNVVCRSEPNPSSSAELPLVLGDRLSVSKETRVDGVTWYFDSAHTRGLNPTCWVYGPVTTEFVAANPEPAVLAMVDHILNRKDKVSFVEFVEVENLMLGGEFSKTVSSSGLLQFRRLMLIDRAVGSEDAPGMVLRNEPLKTAWASGHGDLLQVDPFGGEWYVPPEPFWNLYMKYSTAPWADELAWAAAQHSIPTDECYSDCVLKVKIIDGPLKYWTRRPTGKFIGEALKRASDMAKYAAGLACYDWDPARPKDSSTSPVSTPLLTEIRNSLSKVTAPEKSQLLDYLSQAQMKCAGKR